MLPDNDRGRPGANRAASDVITDGNETSVALTDDCVRCTRCGHALTAPKSVDLELGPVCRRVTEEVA
ncbi:DUF6011 domain-containing protein [Nocardioides sp. CPCC 205120]|uniref:DUF6011 domain-containing protein n=1 Tax=Nocardioides sp. CPCC 205120 TaxID=3406462 RepID=UPI003B504828